MNRTNGVLTAVLIVWFVLLLIFNVSIESACGQETVVSDTRGRTVATTSRYPSGDQLLVRDRSGRTLYVIRRYPTGRQLTVHDRSGRTLYVISPWLSYDDDEESDDE